MVGIPAASSTSPQGHQAVNLALVIQGIVGRLATDRNQSGHWLFVPLDHKGLAGGSAFQELRQATARFFDAKRGFLHCSRRASDSVQTVRNMEAGFGPLCGPCRILGAWLVRSGDSAQVIDERPSCLDLKGGFGVVEVRARFDHPIFSESIRLIRAALGDPSGTYAYDLQRLSRVEQEVLLRLIHSSGDLSLARDVRLSEEDCVAGLQALAAGAAILTDTAMAAAAVAPMARRTFANAVHSVLDWAPPQAPEGSTRAAAGLAQALKAYPGAVVLIGSAPTALELLLEQVAAARTPPPALVIGMPVGFVGVAESKRHLAQSALPQIRLEGSRGGAGLVGAAANALLRRAWLDQRSADSADLDNGRLND